MAWWCGGCLRLSSGEKRKSQRLLGFEERERERERERWGSERIGGMGEEETKEKKEKKRKKKKRNKFTKMAM
ncbi:hypothetical protein ACOSB0_00215, partial [Candidatus Phytoplasma citri]